MIKFGTNYPRGFRNGHKRNWPKLVFGGWFMSVYYSKYYFDIWI